MSRSNGSSDGDSFGLEALSGGSVVDSVTVTLPAVNTWLTVGFTDLSFDAVRMTGYGSAFHPYGVDNIIFGAASEDAGYVSTATDCDDDDPLIGADC